MSSFEIDTSYKIFDVSPLNHDIIKITPSTVYDIMIRKRPLFNYSSGRIKKTMTYAMTKGVETEGFVLNKLRKSKSSSLTQPTTTSSIYILYRGIVFCISGKCDGIDNDSIYEIKTLVETQFKTVPHLSHRCQLELYLRLYDMNKGVLVEYELCTKHIRYTHYRQDEILFNYILSNLFTIHQEEDNPSFDRTIMRDTVHIHHPQIKIDGQLIEQIVIDYVEKHKILIEQQIKTKLEDIINSMIEDLLL